VAKGKSLANVIPMGVPRLEESVVDPRLLFFAGAYGGQILRSLRLLRTALALDDVLAQASFSHAFD
jgi:hypothetical protein